MASPPRRNNRKHSKIGGGIATAIPPLRLSVLLSETRCSGANRGIRQKKRAISPCVIFLISPSPPPVFFSVIPKKPAFGGPFLTDCRAPERKLRDPVYPLSCAEKALKRRAKTMPGFLRLKIPESVLPGCASTIGLSIVSYIFDGISHSKLKQAEMRCYP